MSFNAQAGGCSAKGLMRLLALGIKLFLTSIKGMLFTIFLTFRHIQMNENRLYAEMFLYVVPNLSGNLK